MLEENYVTNENLFLMTSLNQRAKAYGIVGGKSAQLRVWGVPCERTYGTQGSSHTAQLVGLSKTARVPTDEVTSQKLCSEKFTGH